MSLERSNSQEIQRQIERARAEQERKQQEANRQANLKQIAAEHGLRRDAPAQSTTAEQARVLSAQEQHDARQANLNRITAEHGLRRSSPEGSAIAPSVEQSRPTGQPQHTAQQSWERINAAAQQVSPEAARKIIGEINRQEGKINEDIARDVLRKKGYEVLDWQERRHGIDVVARDRQGKLALIEVKTDKNNASFGSLLSETTHKGRQCSDEWVKKTTDEMATDNDPRRRAIAAEIRAHPENVRVLGMSVNVVDSKITLYERLSSDARVWKPLERFSF